MPYVHIVLITYVFHLACCAFLYFILDSDQQTILGTLSLVTRLRFLVTVRHHLLNVSIITLTVSIRDYLLRSQVVTWGELIQFSVY
jgi:hypothetical protein